MNTFSFMRRGMMMADAPTELSRREQNKQDKLVRIVAATRELIAGGGYEALTMRDVAARAEVAVGTVFRYASTKAELLLMVLGAEHAAALEEGLVAASARDSDDAHDAALALLTPVLVWGLGEGTAMLAYQRELLFGQASERYRSDALETTRQLEARLAEALERGGVADAPLAARILFNSLQLELSRALLSGAELDALLAEARRQFDHVLGTAAEHSTQEERGDGNV